MDLPLIWFILIGVLLAGYAVLDGFDFGAGIIQPMFRDARHRNACVQAIGPLWDGNEVWLVTFGGALFAAFPEAYATIMSAFYIPIMLLLMSLILRAVSVDFRNKVESGFWRGMWDFGLFVSSLGASFVFGVAAGNLIRGISLDEGGEFTGTTADFFNVYSLLVGAFAVVVFALHGAVFLILKTTGEMRETLSKRIWHFWGVFLAFHLLITIMTLVEHEHVVANIRSSYWPIPVVIINVLAVANLPRAILSGRFGQAFVSSAINIASLVALTYLSMFPAIVYSSGPGPSLSFVDAASSEGTLWLMLVIAMIGAPLILSYTAIVYWTFRKPIEIPPE